ncbi:MAG: hypothetical protein HYY44_00360 [Deltaproteobacteria bacterium]|nr:hypothetical protein [Deltaproteobacteria bacterium]
MDALEVRSPLLARLGGTPSGTAWFHYPKIAGRVDRLGGSDLPRMVLEGLDRLNVVFDGGRSPLFWRRGLFLPSLQKIHPAGLLTIGLFLFFSVKRDPAEVSIGTGTPSPRNRAC